MSHCVVSFVDRDGVRHSVEVEADSLFEAAAKAISIFKKIDCRPDASEELEVQVLLAATHQLQVNKVYEWFQKVARSPKEAALKHRLKEAIDAE